MVGEEGLSPWGQQEARGLCVPETSVSHPPCCEKALYVCMCVCRMNEAGASGGVGVGVGDWAQGGMEVG